MQANTMNKIKSSFKLAFLTTALVSLAASFSIVSLASANEPTAPQKIDINAGEALYSNGDASRGIVACVGCHGPNGNSASGTWPKLAAQHAGYTSSQLKHFKAGERANPVMMGMSAALQDADMANIAAYLNKQVQKPGTAKTKETIELGQSIYRGGIAAKNVPACAACHGPAGAGIPVQYPRIGGQWTEYTETQLISFRAGVRKNLQMNMIAAKLSDTELKAVSDYIAGLR
jgi:cytochrome c553